MSIVYKNETIMRVFKMHRLKEVFNERKQMGKSMQEAAKYLKIDYRSVSRHMKQKNIGIDVLYRYAEYLEAPIAELLLPKLKRQIHGYINGGGNVNFFKETEERPTIELDSGVAKQWWSDPNTIIICNRVNSNHRTWNEISVFKQFQNWRFLKNNCAAIIKKELTTPLDIFGAATNKKNTLLQICDVSFFENQHIAYNYHFPTQGNFVLTDFQYAEWIATYSSETVVVVG